MSTDKETDNAVDAAIDAAEQSNATPGDGPAAGLPAVAADVVEQEIGDELDNVVPTRGYKLIPTVCLGGSAGGIQALVEFFRAMPADSGLVFVVVLHLSPEHVSTLPELLGNHTAMPVVQARDGLAVEADHVYVIPPGKHLLSVDGHLKLTTLAPERGKRVAVDVFFRTLADTHGAHAAGIVLSGADGDGAIGLKRIKERGGLTVAQDPDEAEHDSMPRSAIATNMVDWVLKTREMPARLLEYFAREGRIQLPAEGDSAQAEAAPISPDAHEADLREVLAFLHARTGRDFSYYKRATVLRRISRRMQINGSDTLPQYLTFLRTHPGEAGALLQDMLISVTNFFRDREAFAVLEANVPQLFRNKRPNDTVRVWVAACATGEEAYSVAMLLFEHASKLTAPPSIQVFATDLAEDVVGSARAGIYPASITTDVSEERLGRFFVKEHRGYRVRRELRGALARAAESGQTVRVSDLAVELDGQRQGVDLQVTPVQEAASYFVVTFTPRVAPLSATAPATALADPLAQQLERELTRVKSRLRDVQEQHEVTVEEHKSSVEELQAINEELRSASEELETSREELQAINEELTTVNAELKARVDELDHSNGDLHNLMAATQIATVFLDRQLSITRYTPPAVGLFNLIPGDVGRPLTDLKHRLDYPELEADAARVLANLAPIERTIGTTGGGWFLARLQPYRTQDDHIAGVVLTFVDIAERLRAEAALRESEARYHALFAGSPVPFMVLKPNAPDFTITAANDAYLAATLNTRESLIGRRLFDVFPDDPGRPGQLGSEALALSLDRVLATGQTDAMERVRYDLVVPGGYEPHWWLAINAPLFDEGGKVSAIIHQVSRVTEMHYAEEAEQTAFREAEESRAEAEAANGAKDHFLAVLSHELRTPLTPITMALAALSQRQDVPAPVRKIHEMIARNVALEARFIDEILDMTRVTRGKMEITRMPMDLHEAVRRAVEISTPDIEAKAQRLTVRLAGDACPLDGDPVRLQQVFWNLLKNASKFTPRGGAIEIRSRCPVGEDLVVEVTDTGIGMEAEAAERIFQPFEQANVEITRQFGGLGLGLAIAKATVEAHGGTLRVSSPGPGQGATFSVRLPLSVVAGTGSGSAG